MAITVPATEAKRRFFDLLRQVDAGRTFTITLRGRPVARMGPAARDIQSRREAREALLARLDSQPKTRVPVWSRDELCED